MCASEAVCGCGESVYEEEGGGGSGTDINRGAFLRLGGGGLGMTTTEGMWFVGD